MGNLELIGIGISEGSLKLAHVRHSPHKREVLDLFKKDISDLPTDDVSKMVRTYLHESKIRNPRIINIIPSHLVITKNIEIPSVKPQEINEIINLQAGRHTPYSREEIIIDFLNIGTHKENYSKILLVIVERNIIRKQFEILGSARMNVQKVILASESLAYSVSKIFRVGTKDAPINLIHIDERFSDFIIVFRNKPIFVRNIPIGTLHIAEEKESYQLRFVEEIKKSLEAYQSEDIEKNPHALILTGAIEELKDLEAILSNNLHLPIKMISYPQNLAISQKALKVIQEAKYSSFLDTITPLLNWEGLQINLIPEEVKLTKSLEERGKELIKTGIYILTVFVLIFSIVISKIHFKSIYLEKLNEKFQSLDKEAVQLEGAFSKINLLKDYLSNRGYSLGVLTELHNVTPLDLKLSNIKYDTKRELSVKGTATSMSTVFSFVDNMEKSEYFKDVKTKYTTKRKDGLKDVTDFEIICMFDKKAD
jgi:Tfp pilus assembly PilM family ATPase/Tfp pilus assembly protein PilN